LTFFNENNGNYKKRKMKGHVACEEEIEGKQWK